MGEGGYDSMTCGGLEGRFLQQEVHCDTQEYDAGNKILYPETAPGLNLLRKTKA